MPSKAISTHFSLVNAPIHANSLQIWYIYIYLEYIYIPWWLHNNRADTAVRWFIPFVARRTRRSLPTVNINAIYGTHRRLPFPYAFGILIYIHTPVNMYVCKCVQVPIDSIDGQSLTVVPVPMACCGLLVRQAWLSFPLLMFLWLKLTTCLSLYAHDTYVYMFMRVFM